MKAVSPAPDCERACLGVEGSVQLSEVATEALYEEKWLSELPIGLPHLWV